MAGGGRWWQVVAGGGRWWQVVAGGDRRQVAGGDRRQVVAHHLCRTRLCASLGGGHDPRLGPRRLRIGIQATLAVVELAQRVVRTACGCRSLHSTEAARSVRAWTERVRGRWRQAAGGPHCKRRSHILMAFKSLTNHLPPPAASHLPPATTCRHLPLATCHHLPAPATTCHHLPPATTNCRLPP